MGEAAGARLVTAEQLAFRAETLRTWRRKLWVWAAAWALLLVATSLPWSHLSPMEYLLTAVAVLAVPIGLTVFLPSRAVSRQLAVAREQQVEWRAVTKVRVRNRAIVVRLVAEADARTWYVDMSSADDDEVQRALAMVPDGGIVTVVGEPRNSSPVVLVTDTGPLWPSNFLKQSAPRWWRRAEEGDPSH